jgi:hypothetical protein
MLASRDEVVMRSQVRWGALAFVLSCAGGDGEAGPGPGSSQTYTEAQAEAACADVARHLRSCGALSEGEYPCASEDFEARDACQFRCLTRASCAEVDEALCAGLPIERQDTALGRCADACVPKFTCRSGESIDERERCDELEDCEDGSDELDCDAYWCGRAIRCDREPQCDDGSDEEGCPEFTCTDGDTIPLDWKCDGSSDCAGEEDEAGCPPCLQLLDQDELCDGIDDCRDGEDEVGCMSFSCGDGEPIPASYRCDSEPDCADGSDELSCPEDAMVLCDGQPIAPLD